jgi:glycosyltransferase involved in cell wall biosynthesis
MPGQQLNEKYISIVIPCHNEEKYITRLLLALEVQSFNKNYFEVIIVDNGCTDGTLSAVWSYAFNTELDLAIVHEETLGVSRARNVGAKLAAAPLIVFLDADNLIPIKFVEDLIKNAGQTSAGTIRTLAEENDIIGKLVFWCLEIIKISFGRPFGKSFVPKSVFNAVGGFNEKIALGENVEFLRNVKSACRKEGLKFIHFPVAITCSLRRFKKTGYFKVLLRWLPAYLGSYSQNYATMSSLIAERKRSL